jgi:L-fuculose-phosphate aldolase
MEGHEDLTLGHVSARAPDGGHVYMKRKGLGLDEVCPADVVTIGLDARRVAGRGEVHLEATLHTEVYKSRPDVGAVIHTHPPYGSAFAAVDRRLLFLTHDAILFPDGVGVFEETAELVTTGKLGRSVARALGDRSALIMRNHGVLVVGRDVRWGVLEAVTLERAIRLQAIAGSLGPTRPIPEPAVEALHASKYREEFVDEYWSFWLRRLRRLNLAWGMPPAPAPRSRGG